MAVNKIIYGGNTLVDLTGNTVTAADLADGVKATGADGNPIVGLMQKVTIDAELSTTSTNPVQNKVIAKAIANMGGGGGGVSTDTANTWKAAQTFGDVVFGGVEKCYWEAFNSNSAKPTKSYVLIFPTASLFTLDMSELAKQTSDDWSNVLRFKIFINNTTNNSYTLKINGITNLYLNNISISDQMILDGIIWGGTSLSYGYISATSLSMNFTGGIS